MKKKFLHLTYFVACLCTMLLTSLEGSAQQVISVRTAISQALEKNLQVRQAQFQQSLSEQDLRQAKMNLYPTLNAGVNGGFNWGLSFDQTAGRLVTQSVSSAGGRINANADLFTGFQRINQIRANRYQLMADESNVERMKNDLVLSVVTTYLEALTNQGLLKASEQQLSLSQQQLGVAEANYEVGNNTLADLSQAKNQVATDELNVTSAQNAFELSILNLKQLMEMDPAVAIALENPALPDVDAIERNYIASQIYQEAVSSFPDIKQAELLSLVAKQNISIARGAFYPTLSMSGGLGTNFSSQAVDFFGPFGEQLRRNRSESLAFTLSIPIFNNMRTRISLARAKIGYENALASEQLAKNNLNKIINQAVLDLRSAEKRYSSTEAAFASAKDAFEVINQRYEVGLANSVELFTAQTTMNRAEFDHIQARYDLLFRSKVIDFYLGNEINFEN
ncbi:TolC family protein [Parapedobacter koreensis]|uniref:Outer membrane protein n=1 Tax=Parapedobacter koreensis TaxID=332977 RepID=A0A1H7IS01_9SPHI|nr:TolC family protein [Parapedobacter koreensis]SEK64487.1 outer membrane protein [Parapedobacter koreensis]